MSNGLNASNGSYKNTIVIRETHDIYLFIDNLTVKTMDKNNFIGFEKIVKDNTNVNIVIDSRMTLLIYYAIIRYGDSVLIYNIGNREIQTIYQYVSDLYKIPLYILTETMIKIWAVILLIDIYYFDGIFNIHPNHLLNGLIAKNVIYNTISFSTIIDSINYSHERISVDTQLVKRAYDYCIDIKKAIERKDISNMQPIAYTKSSANEIHTAFELLCGNNIVINI